MQQARGIAKTNVHFLKIRGISGSVPWGLRTQRLSQKRLVPDNRAPGAASSFPSSILDVSGNSRLPRAREHGRRSLCCFMVNRKGTACWQHQPANPAEAGPALSLDPNSSFKVSSPRRCGQSTSRSETYWHAAFRKTQCVQYGTLGGVECVGGSPRMARPNWVKKRSLRGCNIV